MKVITEATLRSLFRKAPFETFQVEKGQILTPSAAGFLAERRIQILEAGPAAEAAPAGEKTSEEAVPAGEARYPYVSAADGGRFQTKPEHMTSLSGNRLVPKDHPRKYFFYGKPDGKAIIWMRPYKGAAEEPDAEYPFVLTTGRVIDHWHTGTMTMKVPELRRSFPSAYVEVNTKDAKRLGINNGDQILLKTRRDEMRLPARVSDVCREGLVFVPFHYADKLINKLTLDAFDKGSKQPEYKICATKVIKV